MALLTHDNRVVGVVMVGAGLLLAVVALLQSPERPRPARLFALTGLAVIAVGVALTVYLTTPYLLEDARFDSGEVALAGTILIPRGEGPHPGIVFMHGSGPETRAVTFHIASRYAAAGIAALIYDKRRSGDSIGGHSRDTYRELASDGLAAVRFLRAHRRVDANRVGLWGLSEGGWTAPLATSLAPQEIAFMVVVSGAGASTEDEELFSIETLLEDQDISRDGIEAALELRRQINGQRRSTSSHLVPSHTGVSDSGLMVRTADLDPERGIRFATPMRSVCLDSFGFWRFHAGTQGMSSGSGRCDDRYRLWRRSGQRSE